MFGVPIYNLYTLLMGTCIACSFFADLVLVSYSKCFSTAVHSKLQNSKVTHQATSKTRQRALLLLADDTCLD